MNLEELKILAREARENLEKKRVSRKKLARIYLDYNPIKEIDAFLDLAEKIFPKSNCGIATVYLKDIIGKGEIINGSYKDNKHTFLLVDSWILDITSDQYGGPKVYVGELKAPWKKD